MIVGVKRWGVALVMAGSLVVSVTSCGSVQSTDPYVKPEVTTAGAAPSATAAPNDPGGAFPRIGGTTAGSLTSVQPFDTVEQRIRETGAKPYRIKYISTGTKTDKPIEVTGSVFVPSGKAPNGGWRVVSFNHGNTGIGPNCGPSLYDDLLNQWLPVTALLLNGYLVVVPDYEGLGSPSSPTLANPFADQKALGRNVIDAVRATRQLVPDVGTKWVSFGGSLGGLATWASNEQASTYGTDSGLSLLGAAAWVPVADLTKLPAKAANGTLTRDQYGLYFYAVMALKAVRHPEMVLTDYLHGSLYDNRDLLSLCTGPRIQEAVNLFQTAPPTDVKPSSPVAQARLEKWLAEMAVPQQKAAAPMIVIYGSADKLVDQAWIEDALRKSCAKGDRVSWFLRPGEGHGDIDASAAIPWVASRFDGQEALDMCPSGGPA